MIRGKTKCSPAFFLRLLVLALVLLVLGSPARMRAQLAPVPEIKPNIEKELAKSAEQKAPSALDVARSALKQRGLGLDPDELNAYLKRFLYRPETEAKVQQLIAQLGAASFAKRREAQEELKSMSLHSHQLLLAEMDHPDPEVRSRVRAVVGEIDHVGLEETLAQVVLLLKENGDDRPPNFLESVLGALPLLERWTRSNLVEMASEVANPDDREVVERFLEHPKRASREAAFLLLPRVLDFEKEREASIEVLDRLLAPLVRHEELRWRVVAGKALGQAQDLRGLRMLLEVAEKAWKDQNDLELVKEAEEALFSLTDEPIEGDNFGERLHRWNAWMAQVAEDQKRIQWKSGFSLTGSSFLMKNRWRMVSDPSSDLKPVVWLFLAGGKLRVTEGSDETPNNDFWELKGSTLIVRQNEYVTYTGKILSHSYIKGTALNIRDRRWTWECRRLPGVTPAGKKAKKSP